MKCIYCGNESNAKLCDEHQTVAVLDELLVLIGRCKPEQCDNQYVRSYVESFSSLRDAYEIDFSSVLELFPPKDIEYEWCYYLGDTHSENFTVAANEYLSSHDWASPHSQDIIYLLLKTYSRKDFDKPQPYVHFISKAKGLNSELYELAITFFGMIGDYDQAERLIETTRAQVVESLPSWQGRSQQDINAMLDNAMVQNEKWRKKPYWPKSEDAQNQLEAIYLSKGIIPGIKRKERTSHWPEKVLAKEFISAKRLDTVSGDFCAVWIRDVPGKVKCACEVVAVRVEDADYEEMFRSIIRPWKCSRDDKALAASCLGVTFKELDEAPNIFEVLPKLFDFADGLALAVKDTDQVNLLERCARYSGMNHIENNMYVKKANENDTLVAVALASISEEQVSDATLKFACMQEISVPAFNSFVAFDTETTGFGRTDQITEIGAVRVECGEVVDRFQMLANPGKRIPQKVQELTGITDQMVASAKSPQEVAVFFKAFVRDAVLVGHNIDFDLRMLAKAALPAGIDFTGQYFDTNRYAKRFKKEQGWSSTKLGFLAEQLRVELSNAHRALADAEATAEVYLKLRELAL